MGAGQQSLISIGPATPSGPLPTDLANLELWLTADAITGVSDGGNITTIWPDSSGNARDATAVQGASDWPIWQATAGPNGTPRVRTYIPAGNIDNAGWFTLPNFMTGFTSGDVFIVMQKIAKTSVVPGRAGPPIGDWGSNTDEYFVFSTDSKIYDSTGASVRKTTADPGDVTTAAFLYEVRTASGAWSNYKDGVQLFTTAVNTVAFGAAPKVARSTTNTKKYDGYLSDIFFYSRVLDDATERRPTINAYLNDTYGFALPTS
jgi:hypothetical protein